MQLYFIRHAQSENNLLWYKTGDTKGRSDDPELTQTGWQQAEILARYLSQANPDLKPNGHDGQNLAGFHLTHLYTSLMVRAVATGTVVSEALDLPLIAWEELHECGGLYLDDEQSGERIGQPGKNRAFFAAHFPDLLLPDSLGEAGWWCRPFEEREHRPVRAQRFLAGLLERHGGTDDRVAVISHGGFYNEVIKVLLDLPQDGQVWFGINNTAITRIDFERDSTGLVYMNRVDHLPPGLVS